MEFSIKTFKICQKNFQTTKGKSEITDPIIGIFLLSYTDNTTKFTNKEGSFNLWGDRRVLHLECGAGYKFYMCDKMAKTYTHTEYQCQFPGVNTAQKLCKM